VYLDHLHRLLRLGVQRLDRCAPASPEGVSSLVLVIVLEAVHDLLELIAQLDLPDLERLQGACPFRVQHGLGLEAHERHEPEHERVRGIAKRRDRPDHPGGQDTAPNGDDTRDGD